MIIDSFILSILPYHMMNVGLQKVILTKRTNVPFANHNIFKFRVYVLFYRLISIWQIEFALSE